MDLFFTQRLIHFADSDYIENRVFDFLPHKILTGRRKYFIAE